jgi:signal transduction histidine kinase
MQARAAELGGELEIASTPGQGTRLMLTIPLP